MKEIYNELWNLKIGGEPLMHILWCVGIIAIALLLKKTMARLLTVWMAKIANRMSDKKHAATFLELLQRPMELLLTTILFFLAVNQLTVLLDIGFFSRIHESGKIKYAIHLIDAIDKLFLFFLIIFITHVLSRIADFIFHILIDKALEEENKERGQLLPLIKDVVKILLWTIGIFWMLGSVFQVNIPALITGLGIGGVAIALAAKESVENFFASFTILTDKPFSTGDTIRLGTFEGRVEKVGFRSTRLRSLEGSLYIIPNKNLIGDNLENLTERHNRRMRTVVNIPYGMPHTNVQQLISALQKALAEYPLLAAPKEVALEAFNESSFSIGIIYHLPDPLPLGTSLGEVKQEVQMKIYETLEAYLPTGVQKYQLISPQ